MITGVGEAIKKIEKMKKSLPDVMAKLIKEVVELGVERAELYLAHIDTGETYQSIHGEYTKDWGEVSVGGAAIWIEFGTGITKEGYPYELPPGIVEHGEYGAGKGANPNGWWYPDPIGEAEGYGQVYVHTMGIASNPFMTMALHDMLEFLKSKGVGVVKRGVL